MRRKSAFHDHVMYAYLVHARRRRLFTFATFHPSGEWIYAGTSQGVLLIFDARTRWVSPRFWECGTTMNSDCRAAREPDQDIHDGAQANRL